MFRCIIVFIKIIVYIPFRILFPTRIINKEEYNKYKGKGVVFCCNHLSYTDPPTLYILFRRRLNFFVKPELFKNKFWTSVFRDLNCFPVEKGKDLALVRHGLKVLKNNEAVMMFPEGIRALSAEDALNLRNGASMLAIKASVPIVPLVFARAPRIFRANKIKFGSAISTEKYQGRKLEKSDLTELSSTVQTSMASLLDGFAIPPKQKWWEKEVSTIARGITFIDDKILLIKRKKNNAEYFVFPGGHIDEGEFARNAVERETKEETDVVVDSVRLLYKNKYVGDNNGHGGGMQSFFLCNYKHGTPQKTQAEEYAQEPDSNRGEYEPMLVDIVNLENLDLRPESVKIQLAKDIRKYGTRIHKAPCYVGEKI